MLLDPQLLEDLYTAALFDLGNEPIIDVIERELYQYALARHHGTQRRVSSALKIPKSTLHDRLKRWQKAEAVAV